MWALPSELMPSEGWKRPWISGNSLLMPAAKCGAVSSPKLFPGEENNALISPLVLCWDLQRAVHLGITSSPSQSISSCKKLWWVDLGCTPGAHQACHSPPQQNGGENNIEKALLSQEKGSLIRQKKRSHTKAKEKKIFILYFPLPDDVQPLPRKSGFCTQCCIVVCTHSGPEDKHCNNKCAAASHPPFPLPTTFLIAFIAEEMYGMEYPSDQVGSAVLAMFPPKILPTTSLMVRGDVGETVLDDLGAKTFLCLSTLF